MFHLSKLPRVSLVTLANTKRRAGNQPTWGSGNANAPGGKAGIYLGLGLALLLSGASSTLRAHTSLPAYLELNETAPGSFEMLWRVPAAEGPPPAIYPIFPPNCVVPKQLASQEAPASVVERGVIQCGAQGLAGGTIEIDNLSVTILDVLVRITFTDGTSVTQIL